MTIRDADRPRAASACGGAETRSVWRRVTQAIFAAFCLVAVAQTAGLPAADATLPPGSAADKATRADASLDQGRKLLRPKAALAAERVWRAIGSGGSGQDAAVAALLERESLPRFDDRIGFHSDDERGRAWLTVRAGYARAPPTTRDCSEPFA